MRLPWLRTLTGAETRTWLRLTAAAGLYAATFLGLVWVARLAAAAWRNGSPGARLEGLGLAAAMALAAALAQSRWRVRSPAMQAFRYIVWLPILLGGDAGLALIGFWWSIVTLTMMPKAPALDASGLRLDPEREPEIFELVTQAARAVGIEDAPAIYVDLSATVEAGQVRGEAAVVLGLYALALLESEQLGALLTHRFGHTALRPGHPGTALAWRWHEHCWRLLGGPRRLETGAYVFFPRLALGMRALAPAARDQEQWADERAVAAWGAEALAQGRLQLAVAEAAQNPYHQQVLAPVLLLGSRPDLAEGLRHWLDSPEAPPLLANVRSEMLQRRAQPCGVHPPPWPQPVSAEFTVPAGERTAWARLHAPWLLEEQLVQGSGVRLKHVPWEAVARELYLSNWEQVLSEHGDSMRGWTPRRFPELCRDLDGVGRRLLKQQAANYTPGYRARMAETILAISLAMCVKRAGWNVYDLPGRPLWLEREQMRFEPFELVSGLKQGKTSADAFLAQCERAGILDADVSGAG